MTQPTGKEKRKERLESQFNHKPRHWTCFLKTMDKVEKDTKQKHNDLILHDAKMWQKIRLMSGISQSIGLFLLHTFS